MKDNGLFVIDGEESGDTPWEFDTVNEMEPLDLGKPKGWGYKYLNKTPYGLIARAKYRWPIWVGIDGNSLKNDERMTIKVNSRGVLEVWKEKL